MLAAEAADAAAEAAELTAERDGLAPLAVSLYVHVPFCVSKCAYCDFYSRVGDEALHGRFVDAALFEIGHWSHFDLLDDVPSLYVGGGTPTVIGAQLVRLMAGLRATVGLRPDAEVTVESNPETTHPALVGELVAAGANRFSLGVQSFDDAVLSTLGRCHDAARAESAAAVLHAAGVPFSVDLICGVPGQTLDSWARTLETATSCGARHVSVYPLSVESGTPMAARLSAGALPAPDPDLAADMMLAAEAALTAAGMPRYEVASYARPGSESRHNTVYWTGGAYLGVGPAASSMLPFPDYVRVASAEGWAARGEGAAPAPARARFTHAGDLDGYMRRPLAEPTELECLDAAEAAREDVMLGMRLTKGVTADRVDGAGLTAVMASLAAQGLVERLRDADDVEGWRTTDRGWLLGNEVFGAIWAG
jgi:putative oxygen-independent coproporphyrinogen III oxidase